MERIEGERLYLRELERKDLNELWEILSDGETMKYYPSPFDMKKVQAWIEWNIDNYQKYNHGLWAVIRKEGDLFLGDCGITLQDIEGERLPELGYHIHRDHWGRGYASEAARAVMEYAFNELQMEQLYTYAKSDNLPSLRVAQKNGMKFIKSFSKEMMGEIVEESLYGISAMDFLQQ